MIKALNIPQFSIENFPDGTFRINTPELDSLAENEPIKLVWKYENDAELFVLTCITDNLHERTSNPIELCMPYLPNARMDRVHHETEAFTLKSFCRMINRLNFSKVSVLDVHSSVGIALLDRAVNLSPKPYIEKAIEIAGIDKTSDCVFFPDEGSCKRYSGLLDGFRHIGFGIKKRNWDDGKILGLDVIGDITEGSKVLIIDDICSYGGTAYYSALKLKELGCREVSAYFTHCENSIAQGKLFEGDLISRIITTDSLCTLDTQQYQKLNILSFDAE